MLNLSETLSAVDGYVTQRAPNINFLSPTYAACLSAAQLNGIRLRPTFTNPGVEQYAEVIGLTECLNGHQPAPQPLIGRTYSPLVRLASDQDVEQCNTVINDLISNQLMHFASVAQHAYYLVGELHNNVPAHANGAGFSIAQYYSNRGILEVAVADGGCGMLRNVQRFDPSVQSHGNAIKWCLVKGNTTGQQDYFAQRLPDDALSNPYGSNVPTTGEDPNHHVGLGLAQLQKFIHLASGEFAIWSGNQYLASSSEGETIFNASHHWDGVVIVFRLPTSSDKALESHEREAGTARRALAGRVGL